MNKFLWSCAALLALLVTVECLTCKTCDVGVLGYCYSGADVNCAANEDRCYAAVATFSSDLPSVYERGCMKSADCKNSTGSILTVNYTITRTCCNTNLCNGAASVQLPLTAALCAALVAVWSQWCL